MENKIDSYLLHMIEGNELINHPLIHSAGRESWTHNGEKYDWNCRSNDEAICICQYTLNGEGMLELNGKLFRQTANSIFLVERPGNYRYWLPDTSPFWEFKFLSLTMSSLPFWNPITMRYGRTFKIAPGSSSIVLMEEIFEKVSHSRLESVFDNSLLAYTFLMYLHKDLMDKGALTNQTEAIQLCLEFINRKYASDIALVDIAEAGQISPFYLNKYFKEVVGDSPNHYLVKVRIKNSIHLLAETDLSIESIAEKCGFETGNYFAKVFKKFLNESPSEFRRHPQKPVIL